MGRDIRYLPIRFFKVNYEINVVRSMLQSCYLVPCGAMRVCEKVITSFTESTYF